MIPILDSKRQYATIGEEVEKAVCEVLRSGSYILGPNTKAFEQEMADYIGCKYTVGLNYFIKGQGMRVILNYVFCQNDNAADSHRIMLGTQFLI